MDAYTVSANLAGVPALSVPMPRLDELGLPVGLHLVGRHWDEATLLRVADAYCEAAATSHQRTEVNR
jgi:aspartyl-tRNA(Asn)/glutamyl-tRNA(Gln) amidotransferase subunit A